MRIVIPASPSFSCCLFERFDERLSSFSSPTKSIVTKNIWQSWHIVLSSGRDKRYILTMPKTRNFNIKIRPSWLYLKNKNCYSKCFHKTFKHDKRHKHLKSFHANTMIYRRFQTYSNNLKNNTFSCIWLSEIKSLIQNSMIRYPLVCLLNYRLLTAQIIRVNRLHYFNY